jgi:MFS family permease
MRGTFGIGLGFMLPLTSTVVAETHSISYRGKFIGLTKLSFVLGEILSIVFAYFCLDSLKEGN